VVRQHNRKAVAPVQCPRRTSESVPHLRVELARPILFYATRLAQCELRLKQGRARQRIEEQAGGLWEVHTTAAPWLHRLCWCICTSSAPHVKQKADGRRTESPSGSRS
jgi:hypothetical protein